MTDLVLARYKGLDISPDFHQALLESPELTAKICNGVGSELSWTYHLTPDTVWGLDVTPASDQHDWDYTYPLVFATKKAGEQFRLEADERFRANMIKLFERAEAKSWWARRVAPMRRLRADEYYHILRSQGEDSFWVNKICLEKWRKSDLKLLKKTVEHYFPELKDAAQ